MWEALLKAYFFVLGYQLDGRCRHGPHNYWVRCRGCSVMIGAFSERQLGGAQSAGVPPAEGGALGEVAALLARLDWH